MKDIFSCSKCGSQFSKWAGQCLECNAWGTISTENSDTPTLQMNSQLLSIGDIKQTNTKRITTKINELDNILSGGLVHGSLTLLAGEPGIGKSTLLLQIINAIDNPIIYVCGEESPEQILLRVKRLGIKAEQLKFLHETNIEIIAKLAQKHKPKLLIIDSIQSLYSNNTPSEPGNISQVRICTVKLMELAKKHGITTIITSQVTKEGIMAGPKTLEHLVDTVLYLEGDHTHQFRIARITKNRFGATNDIAVFEMKETGLCEILNPSAIFLSHTKSFPGSVVTTVVEGNKVFLVEIQALVSKTVFGYPQRKASGFDPNRLQLLIAVLQKRTNAPLATHDVHLNIVGGYKIKEPSADFAVCCAIISALKSQTFGEGSLVFGEVGLGGEIRPVTLCEKRIKEASKQGFNKIFGPQHKNIPPNIDYTIVDNIKMFYN